MPHEWGGVTAQPHDCGYAGCCLYDYCFTPERAKELLAPELLFGGGAGESGSGGALNEGACPSRGQLAFCTFATLVESNEPDQCCYVLSHGTCCGRPFVVHGQPRLSELRRTDDWRDAMTSPSGDAELSATEREVLASLWAADGLMEHASVASFARFALELMSMGAPADLVEAAQRASLDEVEHARSCFGLASRFAGAPLGPSALDMHGVELARSLPELALAVLREGAIGETLAAALAHEQCAAATDADCRRALERIARDEAAHAVLAWRFLRYAVDRCGAPLAEELRTAAAAARHFVATPVALSEVVAARYGRLLEHRQVAVVDETWREVIEPALQALSGSTSASAASLLG